MATYKSRNDTVNVSSARNREFAVVPPFYFGGEITVSNSGIWYPPRELILTSIWAASSVAGTSGGTALSLQMGDDTFNPDGTTISPGAFSATIIIPQNEKVVSKEFVRTAGQPMLVSTSNWLRIACLNAGGHQDVTIQINAEYS
jgi:hypothetical protein